MLWLFRGTRSLAVELWSINVFFKVKPGRHTIIGFVVLYLYLRVKNKVHWHRGRENKAYKILAIKVERIVFGLDRLNR